MEAYESVIATIALTLGASWASGINLYAVLLVLGLGGATDSIALPSGLEMLENPVVIAAAGLMYCVEFFADKVPGVDTSWDALHTFVRLPAGALLAAGAVGDVSPALELAAAIVGGGMAATSHATKSGTRMLINTSPEPFTNWGASIAEDVAVFAGLWTALNHPVLFIVFLALFLLLAVWLLPKIWRLVKAVFKRIGRLFGMAKSSDSLALGEHVEVASGNSTSTSSAIDQLEQLHRLKADGALTEEEFKAQKARLLQ